MWAGPLVDRRECSRVRLPTPIVCVAYCTLRCHCTLRCTHMAYCYLFGVARRFREASKISKNCIALNIVFHCTMHMVHYCIYTLYIAYTCNVTLYFSTLVLVLSSKSGHTEKHVRSGSGEGVIAQMLADLDFCVLLLFYCPRVVITKITKQE